MSSRRRSTKPGGGTGEDLTFRDRQDGPRPDDTGRVGRRRTRHSKPRDTTEYELAEKYFTCYALHDAVEELEGEGQRTGRPLLFAPIIGAVFELLITETRSERHVVLHHTRPRMWQWYREAVRAAFPDEPHRWLPDKPPTRSQFRYWRATRMTSDAVIELIAEAAATVADDVAITIGIGGHFRDDVSHPRTCQVYAGDATYVRAFYNTPADEAIDRETGELRTRRFDPDALRIQQDRGYPGYKVTHADARTPHTREQVIFGVHVSPGQQGSDATVYTDMVLAHYGRVPGMRVAAYDGALYPSDIDRLLSAGIIPMNHPQYTAKGEKVRLIIGEHNFTTTEGAKVPLVITAVDGTPCIMIATAEGKHEIELERSQTKIRRNADGSFTVGGWWTVPNPPVVPHHLRGAKVWIKHNSTDDDLARKKPRTRALRPIPSTDPDFAALYGVRNDTESKHHVMKSVLPNKRLNVVGLNRVRLRMHAWQLSVTLGAALAWHERTGGDISHLFAQPPPVADAA